LQFWFGFGLVWFQQPLPIIILILIHRDKTVVQGYTASTVERGKLKFDLAYREDNNPPQK